MNTKERGERFDGLSQIGCCICRKPAQIHHLTGHKYRGMGQKAGDEFTIPLCYDHHTGKEGIHVIGKKTWELRYSTQEAMLDWVNDKLEEQND